LLKKTTRFKNLNLYIISKGYGLVILKPKQVFL